MNHLVIIHLLVLDAKTFLAGPFPRAAVVNSSVQLLLCCVAINVKEIIQVCLNNPEGKNYSPHRPALTSPLNRPGA